MDYQSLGYDQGLFTLKASPYSGVSVEHDKSGALKSRYSFKEGRYDGWVEEWQANGKKKTETQYVAGQHEGENRYWHPDGSLQVLKVWKADQLISETAGDKVAADLQEPRVK